MSGTNPFESPNQNNSKKNVNGGNNNALEGEGGVGEDDNVNKSSTVFGTTMGGMFGGAIFGDGKGGAGQNVHNPFDEDEDGEMNGGNPEEGGNFFSNFLDNFGDTTAKKQSQNRAFDEDEEAFPQDIETESAILKKKRKKARRRRRKLIQQQKKVQQWPYDDYHEEQEKYYDSLPPNQMPGALDASDSESDDGMDQGALGGASKASTKKIYHDRRSNSSALYERPKELPPIQEQVRNLGLTEFEQEAKERAINIVSTWIFDCGLIDELIHSGRRSNQTNQMVENGQNDKSEGVEVTQRGVIEIAQQRFEKEMSKLKISTQRELTLINTRLNEGVAATGAEVRELVEAVQLAKSDIHRLRELCSYISSSTSTTQDNKEKYILAPHPKLQKVTWARQNLSKCFREVDFFSQIPAKCDRLREELHSGEYTTNEFNIIRSVCLQHVDLEICLVDAKMGLIKLREQEDLTDKNTRHMFRKDARAENLNALEKFLSIYVKDVWEIGEEIKMRITAGMNSVFDLAIANPAGMVALVESVEVYERAIDKAKEEHGSKQALQFSEMRAAALATIYDVFETRGLDLFRDIHMAAADKQMEENPDEANPHDAFGAIFQAASQLVAEIHLVRHQMSACFPESWAVEILWTSCVAFVCSNQILQQIGGPEGNVLPELTVTQLLDVVAWVEQFRDVAEETFPEIANMRDTKKTYFDSKPDLFAGNAKEVDRANAMDGLAWCNNMLWEVHRLAQEEFLIRIRQQADEWLANVYLGEHTYNVTHEGIYTTSLCEDLFSLVTLQYRTIKEHLSNKSEALAMAVVVIFSHLRQKQIQSRDNFLLDLESCCAAGNDFNRMSEKCEDVMEELIKECDFPEDAIASLDASSSELLALYANDAVFAAQSTSKFIFESIMDGLGDGFFTKEWEETLVSNEIASSLVITLQDYMTDLIVWLDDLLWKKAVEALVSGTVVFYVRMLLQKAEDHTSNRNCAFGDIETALERMKGDERMLREYFEGLESKHPVLGRVIDREFDLFSNVRECLEIAAGLSDSDAEDFVMVMHKRIGDPFLTQHFFGDIWHLVNPSDERKTLELVATMDVQLMAMSQAAKAMEMSNNNPAQPGLKVEDMMVDLYGSSRRKLPINKKLQSLHPSLQDSK